MARIWRVSASVVPYQNSDQSARKMLYNLRMDNIQWTTEFPTKHGHYWVRNYTINFNPDRPEWNEAVLEATVVKIDIDRKCHFINSENPCEYHEWLSAEWYGPIEPPA